MAAPPTLDLFVASEFATSTKLNELWTGFGFLSGQGGTQRPVFQGYQTATQTLTTATWAALTMDSEVVDNTNGHSTVSNTSRLIPAVSGLYRLTGMVAFAGNATGTRHGQFRLNGSQVDGNMPEHLALNFGAGVAVCMANGWARVNGTTDYIELYGWQDSGGNLATARSASAWCSWWSATWEMA